jgi:trehalose 6-phosphate synthase/phosphatase
MKMARILIVSNRLPVTASKNKDKINFLPSAGGLATGMTSFHQNYDCQWIGWPGLVKDKIGEKGIQEIITKLEKLNNVPVFLSQSQIQAYYMI